MTVFPEAMYMATACMHLISTSSTTTAIVSIILLTTISLRVSHQPHLSSSMKILSAAVDHHRVRLARRQMIGWLHKTLPVVQTYANSNPFRMANNNSHSAWMKVWPRLTQKRSFLSCL
jgi:hypothetical protein